ncbi:DUF262 domain-containing HNH endonuclease family protein [uncultured Brachyspira sp.]|uniref:DUF262 domain-containing protein n=1 Tax=uncultured Brachyspira sp. TaxID=221953 RepID=UPI00259BB1CB|nr:DUF262 domain-containing HNH endonuclease family protein [uncultured Brachyspira sp.]
MEFKPEKQYIAKLLGEEGQKFIIPEYQRPYRWTKNECETLWDDVNGVFGNGENIEEYFLGSIVAFESKKSELEIIDGQQRITTLTLLFRAFYECFSNDAAKEKQRYLEGFGKCVWEHDLDKGLDFKNCHLSSKVIADRDEKILKKLLSEKITIEDIKGNNSNYAKNYIFFYEKLEEFKLKDTLLWEKFCKMFLTNRLFILLVICDSQESAMTIFNTLNSRGLPLSNADILKGYIYKKVKNKEKFANDWKDIETKIEESENVKDLDFLFLQYMHIIRAENEDTNTTTQGILPFFTKTDKKEYYGALQDWLYKPETMPFISNLSDFWISPKEYLSEKSSRYISILNLFQNDTWKFFVSYLVWRNKNCFNNDTFNKNKFSKEFDKFLPELIKYITLPFLNNNATTGVVKEIVFKMNVSLYKKENFTIGNSMPKQKVFFEIINSFDTRKIKYILFLYAYIYSKFKEDINASDLEVEHILPKEWQNMDVSDFDEESHKKYVEKIGNKILLDKKSNIKCSNNFFAKKQEIYKKIYDKGYNLKEVYDLGIKEHSVLKKKEENKRSIWEKKDIENREEEIYKNLNSFLSSNN